MIWIFAKCMRLMVFGVVLLLAVQASAAVQTGESGERAEADTVLVTRGRMRSRALWEEIVYLPGRIVFLPVEYALKGVGATIGYVADTKLIPKVEDFLTSDDGRRGVKPTYSGRTGGGIQFYQKGLFGASSDRNVLELTATGGSLGQQRYQCTLEGIRFAGGRIWSDLFVRYRKLPTEAFFGIGPGARLKDETEFAQTQTSAEVSFGTHLGLDIAIEALAGYDKTEIAAGDDPKLPSTVDQYTEIALPGIGEPVDMMHVRLALMRDAKNRQSHPTDGYEATVSGGWYRGGDGDRFGFAKYIVDLAAYLHLFYDRALAFRIAGELTEPFKDREIPFYYLSELGRRETIRGFARGRFRDRDMALASVEYRYPIWQGRGDYRANFALFADVGQVSRDLVHGASLDDLQTGFGFGLRVWGKEGLAVTFEAARSDEGWRYYFVLN